MTPTDLLVPTYQHMLQTLSGLLDKVQQQMPDPAEAVLEARLAADMFPLATQVRFAAFQAQEAVFRLRGEPNPDWLDAIAAEARNAGDAPGTIADVKARLNDALSFLADVSSSDLDAGAGLPIAIELPGGMAFDMTGEQYARDWALPQFYFHVHHGLRDPPQSGRGDRQGRLRPPHVRLSSARKNTVWKLIVSFPINHPSETAAE